MNTARCGYWSEIVLGAGLVLFSSGCGSTPAAQDPATSSAQSTPAAATTGPHDREATVQLSKAFRQRCSLPEDAQETPVFAFGEAKLHTPGKNVLDDVAHCLTIGPLKGEEITIIGRADARGTKEYNAELGQSRAAAARDYLVKHGVTTERVHLMSRGETGARGDAEESYLLDRRVDLELGNLDNSPLLDGTMSHAETAPAPSTTKAGNYADTADGPVGGSSVTGTNSAAGSAK